MRRIRAQSADGDINNCTSWRSPQVWITPKNSYTTPYEETIAAIEFCKILKEKTRTQEPAESDHNGSRISLALST